MASPSQDASTLLASSSAAPVAHEGAARVFWRVLTRFDSSKLSPYLALRNSIGVLLPLVAGFALDMPRGGLVVASGALNVAYSDGSDSYAQRAKRMLSSSGLCALAVLFGALSGSHSVAAVTIATLWAFAAGMLVAAGTTAADLAVISLVTLLIYAAQPLTPRQALISTELALGGGLLQTALSVALWPVQRYEPERRALANFFLELARAAEQPLSATSAPPATVHSTQAQEAENLPASFLAAVARDARFQMDGLNGQLRAALDLTAHATPAGQAAFAKQEAHQPSSLRFSGLLATLRANLNLQSSVLRHAIRLAVMVALGNGLERAFYWHRSYWLPMTIVLVRSEEHTSELQSRQ